LLLFLFCSGDEAPVSSEPLIDVIEGGQYTGESLANLIRSVRDKLESNLPAEEFKVNCIKRIYFYFCFHFLIFQSYILVVAMLEETYRSQSQNSKKKKYLLIKRKFG